MNIFYGIDKICRYGFYFKAFNKRIYFNIAVYFNGYIKITEHKAFALDLPIRFYIKPWANQILYSGKESTLQIIVLGFGIDIDFKLDKKE